LVFRVCIGVSDASVEFSLEFGFVNETIADGLGDHELIAGIEFEDCRK